LKRFSSEQLILVLIVGGAILAITVARLLLSSP